MIRLLALTCLTVACACGGGHPAPTHPAPDPAHHADPLVETRPSAAECDQLIAHGVELGMAEQRTAHPPERVPTEDQRAKIEADLRASLAPRCRDLPRPDYDCAIAATSLDQLVACDRTAQTTRSSSTSNSSVAPGGITPPAPRSP